jgi:predicted NAD-dependent protein-ADP-ribosyltransferase YbiA (DUF1768 family)
MAANSDYSLCVMFGSNAYGDMHKLSNFYATDLLLRPADLTPELLSVCPNLKDWVPAGGLFFPTSEHLWQALKATDKQTFLRFTSAGDLGLWKVSIFANTVAPSKLAKEKKNDMAELARVALKGMLHWQKKHNLGIQAKLAANKKYAKKLNLDKGRMNFEREHLAPATERSVWLTILKLKFAQNAELREILSATRGKRLVETPGRGKAEKAHWSGRVKDGKLIGDNVMGLYMEAVRESLF